MQRLETSTWRGPDHYTTAESALFNGRSAETAKLLQLIDRDLVTLFFGASGTGKTSLLQAGLFPVLGARYYLPVHVRLDHAESAPRLGEQVMAAIRFAAEEAGFAGPAPVAGDLLWQHFHRKGHLYWDPRHHLITPVIALDELDELFTHGQESAAAQERSRRFIDELSDLLQDRMPDAVRAGFAEEGSNLIDAGYMAERAPLKVVISFDEAFLPQMAELREALPARCQRMRLTGPVASVDGKVVSNYYERAFQGVSVRVRRFVEDRLVSPEGRRRSIRQEQALSERGVTAAHLDTLVTNRLLKREKRGGTEHIELTHDLLLGALVQSRRARYAADARRTRIRRLVQRVALITVAAALVLGSLSTLLVHYLFIWEHQSHFAHVERGIGAPVGTGELSSSDVARRDTSYRFVRRGRLGPVMRVEAVGRKGELTPDHGSSAFFNRGSDNNLSKRRTEVEWRYRYDDRGRLLLETAYDREHRPVYTLSYPAIPRREAKGNGVIVTAALLGEPGAGLTHQRGKVELLFDETTKYLKRVRYLDAHGRAIPGRGHVLGETLTYNAEGRITGRTAIDAEGRPMPDDTGVATETLVPDDFGQPVEIRRFGADKRPTADLTGVVMSRAGYDHAGNRLFEAYFGDNEATVVSRDGYHRAEHTYDPQGREVRTSYSDVKGGPTHDRQGCFGYVYKPDPKGRPGETTCVDAKGRPLMNAEEYATRREKRDIWGDAVETAFFDAADKPTLVRGSHRVVLRRDGEGREIERRFYLSDGQPAEVTGYARASMVYDKEGALVTERFFDAAGKPALLAAGYNEVVRRYDEEGRLIEARYLSPDGAGTGPEGIAGYRLTYDRFGDETSRAFFGPDGAAALSKAGYAAVTTKRDQMGRAVMAAYLGLDGKPIADETGVAGWHAVYDAAGRKTRISYVDRSGAPTINADGYAGMKHQYDAVGNETRMERVDLAGHPTLGQDGVGGAISEYDAWGHLVYLRYIDENGKPVAHREGYAGIRRRFDQEGRLSETTYLDARGEPAAGAVDGSRLALLRDEKGRPVAEACYDVYGKPMLNSEGWFRAEHVYDARGNPTTSKFYDRQGEPVQIKAGYHRVERTFDQFDHPTSWRYFAVDGAPALGPEGSAEVRRTYVGQVLAEQSFFDAKGQPVLGAARFHKEVRQIDAAGRTIGQSYFGADLKPMLLPEGYHRVALQFDEKGKEASRSFYDVKGMPVVSSEGYAKVAFRYAPDGRLVEQLYLGTRDEPATTRNGYARLTWRYVDDPQSGAYEETLSQFSSGGRYTLGTDGRYRFAQRIRTLDAYGRITSERFLGPAGVAAMQFDGCALWRYENDIWGHQVKAACYRDKELPTRARGNYHRMETAYNARGQVLEIATYDTNGRAIGNKSGYARLKNTYDDNGRIISVETFDPLGRPSTIAYGYAKVQYAYDKAGHRVSEAYFGTNGKPLEVNGEARVETEYDDSGNQIAERQFNRDGVAVDELRRTFDDKSRLTSERAFENGAPANFPLRAYHETRFEHDQWGRLTRQTYYDKQGTAGRGVSPKGLICGQWVISYDADNNPKELCDPRLP